MCSSWPSICVAAFTGALDADCLLLMTEFVVTKSKRLDGGKLTAYRQVFSEGLQSLVVVGRYSIVAEPLRWGRFFVTVFCFCFLLFFCLFFWESKTFSHFQCLSLHRMEEERSAHSLPFLVVRIEKKKRKLRYLNYYLSGGQKFILLSLLACDNVRDRTSKAAVEKKDHVQLIPC